MNAWLFIGAVVVLAVVVLLANCQTVSAVNRSNRALYRDVRRYCARGSREPAERHEQ